ncbi:MAG: hemerythrin domain-containing protein [bacterium]|nr:hemerythrin domain-containing protein [bacterium]
MQKPTEILTSEHKNILKVTDAMLAKCGELESGAEIDKDFFVKAIDFIKNYADRFHHAKEEDVLFREMRAAQDKLHCSPMDQMLFEHEEGRKFVKDLEDALVKEDRKDIEENARGYANLLQDHIFKEDNILYPMADEALGEDIQTKMAEEFAQVEELEFNEKDWE